MVVHCTGYTFNADFLKQNFPQAISNRNQIYVNNNFQITSTDPVRSGGVSAALKQNVFAFGDCCQTSLNEEKNIPAMKFMAAVILNNIQTLASGQGIQKSIPAVLPYVIMVSLGPGYAL